MRQPCTVYFVDDEPEVRQAVHQTLVLNGYDVASFSTGKDMLKALSENWPGVIVSDLKMPDMDGMGLLEKVLEFDPELPFILVSGHADIADAVKAMQRGAYDFIEKVFTAEDLRKVVQRALDKRALVLDNRRLRAELSAQRAQSQLIGRSAAMVELRQTIEYVADTNADVLIHGETGTGKELVAESIHQSSRRKAHRFVPINCGAMPETLFESEVFGHVRGAFTSADKAQMGKMEYANHGTFFLDEIEGMPMNLQVKLLRALQERTIQRLGSNKSVDLDLRVVAATKTDLLAASQRGEFREDLYYRLNVVTLTIPPLRERKEDIPILFQHFHERAQTRHEVDIAPPSTELINGLMEHDWPGNVRELQNFAERVAIGLATGLPNGAGTTSSTDLSSRMNAFEKITIEQELVKRGGNITDTYTALGVSRKTLYDKMKKHGLHKRTGEPKKSGGNQQDSALSDA